MELAKYEPVRLADGKFTGVAVIPPETTDQPVLLYLHGGGGTYSEGIRGRVPQLPFAAALGVPGYSINRPDNMDSVSLNLPTDIDDGFYAASAEAISEAAEDIWNRHKDSAPGIVLQGCSVGSAIAFTLAAQWAEQDAKGEAMWPLLGLIVADVGYSLRPGVAAALGKAPDVMHVDDALNTVAASLDFGPEWAKDNLEEGEPLTVPRSEILELVGAWPKNALDIASKISVPVMYRLGELDPLWFGDDDTIATLVAALKTSSPYVDAKTVEGSIHPVFESRRGHAFTLETVAFAEFCRAAAAVPQLLDKSAR